MSLNLVAESKLLLFSQSLPEQKNYITLRSSLKVRYLEGIGHWNLPSVMTWDVQGQDRSVQVQICALGAVGFLFCVTGHGSVPW